MGRSEAGDSADVRRTVADFETGLDVLLPPLIQSRRNPGDWWEDLVPDPRADLDDRVRAGGQGLHSTTSNPSNPDSTRPRSQGSLCFLCGKEVDPQRSIDLSSKDPVRPPNLLTRVGKL